MTKLRICNTSVGNIINVVFHGIAGANGKPFQCYTLLPIVMTKLRICNTSVGNIINVVFHGIAGANGKPFQCQNNTFTFRFIHGI